MWKYRLFFFNADKKEKWYMVWNNGIYLGTLVVGEKTNKFAVLSIY